MVKNIGTIDRSVRIFLGLALIAWGYLDQNWWGAVGIVPLLTALIGWCPAYLPFGIRTNKGAS